MLSKLRSSLEPATRRLARPLARLGCKPNQVTWLGVPLSLAAAGCLSAGFSRPATVLAGLACLTDLLDGSLARLQGGTDYGNLLDAVVDRVVEGVLLLGLSFGHPRLAFVALLVSLLPAYIKARTGLILPLDNRDWPGWGDRADRLTLVLLAYACPRGVAWLLGGLIALGTAGCLQRLAHARSLLHKQG